ncbi:hemicentin-1 [Caerostris darwini]|uniref:Hemicentin-1 n=1 Tax=Caerostris darwini TaxID=1538125 RepID=A0AAV4Q5X0_9ARAC|nr:hemicentin-1 [Caerostris darwini]
MIPSTTSVASTSPRLSNDFPPIKCRTVDLGVAPAGWVQLLLQEENLLIVAGISGGIGVLLIILLTTAVAVVLRRRMKANSKEALQERHHPENGDRAADCTPIGASPLLSGHRQDDSPLLRKKFPDHEFVYHDPSMEKSNGIYRNQQGRKLVG